MPTIFIFLSLPSENPNNRGQKFLKYFIWSLFQILFILWEYWRVLFFELIFWKKRYFPLSNKNSFVINSKIIFLHPSRTKNQTHNMRSQWAERLELVRTLYPRILLKWNPKCCWQYLLAWWHVLYKNLSKKLRRIFYIQWKTQDIAI